MSAIRDQSLARLKKAGFRVSPSLPIARTGASLRPLEEIAARLMALDAVFTWVSQLQVETKKLKGYVARNELVSWMTPSERAIWKTARKAANVRHVDEIGWRLENMWPLAWILGFDPAPAPDGEMIDGDTIRAMFGFMPKTTERIADLLGARAPRAAATVLAMEDLFYCAHNAARSAQLGDKTVPKGFHPIAGGGVIHERRHALTWATSPGVDWEETDLST